MDFITLHESDVVSLEEVRASKAWATLLFGLGLGCTGNWGYMGGVAVGVETGGNCNFCCIGNVEGDKLKDFSLQF